jgi:hypothetical protein
MRFFVAHDILPILLSHLVTYGGMARNTRMQKNPNEEVDGTFAGAHAIPLANVFAGRSVTDPKVAILTLQFDAGQGRKLNQYVAANEATLVRLQTVCAEALASLRTSSPGFSPH